MAVTIVNALAAAYSTNRPQVMPHIHDAASRHLTVKRILRLNFRVVYERVKALEGLRDRL